MKEEIFRLRGLGYSYNRIVSELGCSKSLVSYYCGDGQREKYRKRNVKNRTGHDIATKIWHYQTRRWSKGLTKRNVYNFRDRINKKIKDFRRGGQTVSITTDEIMTRINNNPHCELTGLPIDIENTSSWHLDHRLPVSRGGDNSIENLQILSARANQSKNNMTNEEFIELCKRVLEHNGYTVS